MEFENKQEKLEKIKACMTEFFHEHGTRVVCGTEYIAEQTGIPASELHDPDNFEGLCDLLSDEGYLDRTGSYRDPSFGVGRQLLEDEFRW